MRNKTLFNLFLIVGLILLIPSSIEGYEIGIDNWRNEIFSEYVNSINIITNENGLDTKLFYIFGVDSSYLDKNNNITIHFSPWESITNKPIQNISIKICEKTSGGYSWNFETGYSSECNKTFVYNISSEKRESYFINNEDISILNYTIYTITFIPENISWGRYILLIDYTTPNFVSKEGDYYTAWLRFPNMGDKTQRPIENALVLPSKEDIPRFIPDAKRIEKTVYFEGNKPFLRWVFVFEGAGDKIVWYQNEKEIKENEENLQWKYLKLSLLFGGIFSLIFLFFEKLFFDWSCWGNKFLRWLKNKLNRNSKEVFGNENNKVYHRIDCKYMDNISSDNIKPFKNREEAIKDDYEPCKICKPNN